MELQPGDVEQLVKLSSESKASANAALAAGDLERASELYKRGLSRFADVEVSEHPEALELVVALYLNQSLLRLKMKDPKRARNAADRALQLQPECEKGLYRRATAALQLGDVDAAEADMLLLLTSHPDNKAAEQLLADARAKRKANEAEEKRRAARMFSSDNRAIYDDVAEGDAAASGQSKTPDAAGRGPAEDDIPSLPANWEVVKGKNGAETWRRKPAAAA
eukprot:TRINITY_DN8837_c0_g2_i1.p1 TRINITY_DN8837_c0_g2~~TRINITY_DN8837_c0_g2_i1.p1  ORF type:complete len:251 (-),score=79.62 TRINITY_DN8837_c0_g2_i1:621-1286(-)